MTGWDWGGRNSAKRQAGTEKRVTASLWALVKQETHTHTHTLTYTLKGGLGEAGTRNAGAPVTAAGVGVSAACFTPSSCGTVFCSLTRAATRPFDSGSLA
jgi:hypothetical protein